MNDIELILLSVAAFLGMLLNAALGCQDALASGEKFKKGKFLSSIGRGIFTVVLAVISFPTVFPSEPIGVLQYLTTFLLGEGVDTVGHGLSKSAGISERLS